MSKASMLRNSFLKRLACKAHFHGHARRPVALILTMPDISAVYRMPARQVHQCYLHMVSTLVLEH